MDSFLDEPRAIPKPTPVIQDIETPAVPEVSLMFQNLKKGKTPIPVNYGKTVQSYNAWKLRNNTNNAHEYDSFLLANTTNKENITVSPQTDKSFLKKQVRFESPVQKTSPVSHYPVTKQNVQRVTETSPLAESSSLNHLENQNNNLKQRYNAGHYSSVASNTNKTNSESPIHNFATRQVSSNYTPSFATTKPGESVKEISKPFEKLYVSNIPNRELDLSFLEPQKNPCSSIKAQTYKPTYDTVSPKRNEYNDSFKPYTPRFNNINSVLRTETPSKMIQNKDEPAVKNNDLKEPVNVVIEITNSAQNDKKQDCDENEVCDNTKKLLDETESKSSSSNAVTVSDLLTIIKMQNDQLKMLQNQVNKLVKLNEKSIEEKSQKPIENVEENKKHVIMCKDQQVGTSFEDIIESQDTIDKDGKKISVGMMTSFEVSFKPPVAKKKNKVKLSRPVEDDSQNTSVYESVEHYRKPPKKQEYVKRNKKNHDRRSQQQHYQHQQQQQYQLHQQQLLQEQHQLYQQKLHQEQQHQYHQQQHQQKYFEQHPQKYFEQHPQKCFELPQKHFEQQQERMLSESGWNNKGINETEYSLGSQESLEIAEPPESPENSIHIDMQEYDTDSSDDECSTDEGWTFYNGILGQVNHLLENSSRPAYASKKEVANRNYPGGGYMDSTLEEIKYNTMKRLQSEGFLQTNNGPMKSTEVSFAVKQILMKYLPDEGLANAVTRNNENEHYKPDKRKPTDISVTAFQYMQQCNVVRNNPQQYYGHKDKNNVKKPSSRNKMDAAFTDPKILDITALKQQPKFL